MVCVNVCEGFFTIQKQERALQQSEKVGQTSTSKKRQQEVGRGDAEGRRLRRQGMTEESRNCLANKKSPQ